MKIFNGKELSEEILLDIKEKIKEHGILPCLAVILIGSNSESELYIKKKRQASEKIGIKFSCYAFGRENREEDIINKIEELNNDSSVHGIIVQLPLISEFDTKKIIKSVDPKKDVDGFHEKNRNLLINSDPYFFPVLPLSILMVMEKEIKDFKEKKIIALTNSDIFGKTLKMFFEMKGVEIECLVKKDLTILEIKEKTKQADILISVLGKPGFIVEDMIKQDAALIDAGFRIMSDKKCKGDVDRKSVKEKAGFLTPVPGGIGPLTVSMLLKNVYLSAINNK